MLFWVKLLLFFSFFFFAFKSTFCLIKVTKAFIFGDDYMLFFASICLPFLPPLMLPTCCDF